MRSLYYLCVCISLFQISKQVAEFHEMLYELYTITRHHNH
jgi:hypothetical protein